MWIDGAAVPCSRPKARIEHNLACQWKIFSISHVPLSNTHGFGWWNRSDVRGTRWYLSLPLFLLEIFQINDRKHLQQKFANNSSNLDLSKAKNLRSKCPPTPPREGTCSTASKVSTSQLPHLTCRTPTSNTSFGCIITIANIAQGLRSAYALRDSTKNRCYSAKGSYSDGGTPRNNRRRITLWKKEDEDACARMPGNLWGINGKIGIATSKTRPSRSRQDKRKSYKPEIGVPYLKNWDRLPRGEVDIWALTTPPLRDELRFPFRGRIATEGLTDAIRVRQVQRYRWH